MEENHIKSFDLEAAIVGVASHCQNNEQARVRSTVVYIQIRHNESRVFGQLSKDKLPYF